MADLSVIYSKTPRGLRARASLIGGLSSHLMKVLSFIDGTSKAEAILLKFDHLTPEALLSELAQLEQEGYIKASGNTRPNEEWSPTVHFTPMVVEEYQSEEELDAIARAKAEADAKLAADRKANAEAAAKREAEREAAEQAAAEASAKAKAEAKVQERLEAERIAHEAEEARLKAEAEAKAKAEEASKIEQAKLEVARIAQAEEVRLKAEASAKAEKEAKAKEIARLEQEERQRAALKAHEEEEQVQAKAEAEAKENTRRELERIAKEAEESQKKAEAEVKARIEEEAKAKLEAARVAQAEEDARIEAENRAKAAQEAKAKEKEKAHLEIERVLREAEQKRKKSANKAKEEKLEAKRKAKAEEDRIKAERKAKEEIGLLRTTLAAEEKAKEEVKESARIQMERIAQEAEEKRINSTEKSHKKDEDEAKIEAERIKTRLQEEENEKTLVIENTRLEMARISKEADALRKPATILRLVKTNKVKAEVAITVTEDAEKFALAKMEERARKEAERLAEEAEELAEIEAEEKAQKKAKKFAHTQTKPNKKINFEETKQAEIESPVIHVAKEPAQFRIPAKAIKRWVSMASKMVLVYLPLVLLLMIGVMHFINLSMLAPPIEKLISKSVEDAVDIQEIRVALLPEPHLVLGNMTIGKDPGTKIESVYVVPTRASLFDDVKVMKSVVIEGMQINQENFRQQLQWIRSAGKTTHLKIEDLHIKNLAIKARGLELGIFDGKLELSATRELESIDLISSDHTLNVQILPLGGTNNITLNGTNWALPTNPKIVFSVLKASGISSQDGINFSKINGELYGGTIVATALVDWSSQWNVSGNFDLMGVSATQMLTAFNSTILVEGKLKLTGNFASRTGEAAKLISAAEINADFVLNDGSLNGIELTRAVLARGDQSLMGDDTHFDKLVGSLQVNNSLYQYRKLVLQSPQFNASGNFDISPNQQLSGKINADLTAQSRRLRANFSLAGSSSNVRSQ